MYRYDEFDHSFVSQRVAQFRDQVERRLAGELSEDEFKPLRLMNGLYLQLHAYMLRVAIPYGSFNGNQMRKLAHIARTYDKGYGHFTTRQNIQYNWPVLQDVPAILDDLASVEMHAIQTSGNCIRNTTSDQYAGAAADEIEDPRVYCEIIRQWSSLHPEFTFLPRKFKVAVTGATYDRAAIQVHDIGLALKQNEAGEVGFEVYVGGGQGRTPMIAKLIRDFLPKEHLLSYLEAILRVYNQYGRRDNKYKARIKILVHETGIDEIRERVEEEWNRIKDSALKLPQDEIDRINTYFAPPSYEELEDHSVKLEAMKFEHKAFNYWVKANVADHKQPGYAIANISLKPVGEAPGDITAEQMDIVADLAEKYSLGEIRATHEQNLTLVHVKKDDLFDLWQELEAAGLGTANLGMISDMIACPGLDYCALANARAIPVAQNISNRFADLERQHNIGELKLKISGCINACGHHHVGHIGILGVDRKGLENYQITLGGSADNNAAVGKIIGPGFGYDDVVDAVENIVNTYVDIRESEEETFLQTYNRVGLEPFKERLYAA
ncbi:nitrite/sulfite reductase [Kiloniella sp. b19]|uniref:nitrite/sulfite reductase n=1 Tax=Kiloniella sp. GXU_MW_B19 TaxID=3141326 RepID=UPI0031E1AB0C